ncbi:arginine--tRNA ligase [Candidatus Saccharibacteria bacterium]|nr:arginine--tRNA ligase [Candidatus Saccharibacteria bacterium]
MNDIKEAINKSVKELFGVDVTVELTRPDAQFGDFSSNIALQLVKKLANPPAGGPREIAEILVEKIRDHQSIAKAEVAGPGFINVTLTDSILNDFVRSVVDSKLMDRLNKNRDGQTIVIETNNPNPFKAMHIGHAFNAILADTIANLLDADGAKVYRVSYHGDVGLHVGKSMYSLLKYIDGDTDKLNSIAENERNSFMSRMYAEGSKAYKDDESVKVEIDELAQQSFQPKSVLYREVYDVCKEWSFRQIDQTVARLGNKPIEEQGRFLESDADDRGVKIVRDNVPEVFQESDGALIFPGSKYGAFDNAFVASNGRGLYAARDLGLMQLKNEYYHPKKSYIVTAEEQRAYFVGVIAAAELCMPDQKDVTVNISHGTVKLTTGKMSSRDGDVVEIDWLLEQIANAVKEHGGEDNQAIEAGALRYQFLKVKIGSDVVFDINEAISVAGNSGPYLQYAHARGRSILEKSANKITGSYEPNFDESERLLVRKMTEYPEIIEHAARELAPHYICTYLYELSQEFNRFYEKNRVIGDEAEVKRLSLVSAYVGILKSGLALLGIEAPSRV